MINRPYSYSFNFVTENEIYVQTGFGKLQDARNSLHNIADLYCNNKGDKGIGKITRHSPDSSFLVEKCECIMKRKILHIYDKLPDLHKD
ncbi:MAG TPA: hypothetical protein ENG87_02325 [Candidatus Pacearchaeota archaeon]|nr:hypothetical protein BMS3Abin17_00288 [archaeon BMS3Abin17]HDK42191.1 hypothetical protein [Candidatus Pacearchaeota archaeon]HDZ60368.1 hypothetical protein [Candidatus Pacearchaeota archaeon]